MRANGLAAKAFTSLKDAAYGMNAAAIARATNIGKNNVGRVLADLQTAGLVEKMEREPFEVGHRWRAVEGAQLPSEGEKTNGAKPKKARGKNRPKNPVKTQVKTTAKPPKDAAIKLRVGLFNDGCLAILAKRGSLELDEDETIALAEYLSGQFTTAEA